ncbi:MAG: hypothetical protein JKY66_10090 [Spongiibacteraceae bacterium]|nr:hypothetical protein [Spongiibacteraceae bacterium]
MTRKLLNHNELVIALLDKLSRQNQKMLEKYLKKEQILLQEFRIVGLLVGWRDMLRSGI